MKKILMDEKAINRALTRISHEIIEKNKGVDNVIILGIKTRGVVMAQRIVNKVNDFESQKIPFDVLDITFYRDDLIKKTVHPIVNNRLNINVENKIVILVDDVIFTGRTLRAAIEAVFDTGRPKKIQFAALIDRGHRELPLKPDYIGKNIPTSTKEVIKVKIKEIDDIDEVILKIMD